MENVMVSMSLSSLEDKTPVTLESFSVTILMLLALSNHHFFILSFGIKKENYFSTTGNDVSYVFSYLLAAQQSSATLAAVGSLYFILLCIHVCISNLLSNVQYHQQDKSVKTQEQCHTAGQLMCDCLIILVIKTTGPTELQNNMQTLDSW